MPNELPAAVAENVVFFIGTEDPVFSAKQTVALAEKVGVEQIRRYENGGHLLFLTHPEVFDDILDFFQQE